MTAKSLAITAVPATAVGTTRPGWRTRWAERDNERRRRDHDAAAEAWRRRADELTRLRTEATAFHGCTEPRAGLPVELADDEVVFRVLPAAELVEAQARHVPGLPAPGLNVAPVTTEEPGCTLPRGLRVVDAGMAVVTDRRIAFAGRNGRREWTYADLLGPAHHPDAPFTLLHTTAGGKLAGLLVPVTAALNFRFYLTLAFGDATGRRAAVAARLDDLVANHERSRPVVPRPVEARDAPPTALLHDRRLVTVAATAVAVLATVGVVGTVQGAAPSPAAVRENGVVGAFGTDASTGISATSGTAPTTGAGPNGIVTSPTTAGGPNAGLLLLPPPSPGSATPPGPADPTTEPAGTSGAALTTTPPPSEPTAVDRCGAPENPYGYNYCGGSQIFQPAADVCSYFACVDDFWSGEGYLVQCRDRLVSLSGGQSGACAAHRGAKRTVYA